MKKKMTSYVSILNNIFIYTNSKVCTNEKIKIYL